MMHRVKTIAALALAALLPLTACSGAGTDADSEPTITVLAASSLTDVFTGLAEGFEAEHDAKVRFSFGSSTDLAEQAADGAPGDVLATADETSMNLATDAGVTGDVAAFATNVLTIVVPKGNPAGVTSLDDLADTAWVRCADEVPCGKVAAAVLAANGITAEPASLEEDVRATLDKVITGEADAGLVYATDAVAASDDVDAIEIPGAAADPTTYLLTPLAQSAQSDLAADWVAWVTSPQGEQILIDAGFGPP